MALLTSTSRSAARTALDGWLAASATSASPSSSRLFTTSKPSCAKPRIDRNDDNFELDDMGEFGYDDVPTLGHKFFNRQRELLKYARVVTHDFPQLEQLRQPYEPPSKENFLKFRSMHYQGVAHPASRKSVLVVDIKDIFSSPAFASLSGAEAIKAKRKFLHLAGPRWDPGQSILAEPYRVDGDYSSQAPEAGNLKISCERFPLEIQNMKWCSDVLDEMIAEARNTSSDEVWKLPLDERHRVVKDRKKASGGKRRKATIADWPQHWPTEGAKPST